MPGTGLAWSVVVVGLSLAVAIARFRNANASAGLRHAEGIWPSIALGVIFATPSLLAAVGVRISRPVLVGTAAVACAPLLILSIAAFPIVVPAGLFALAFAKSSGRVPAPPARTLIVCGVFVVGLVVAMGVWLSGWGQYNYVFAGGSVGGDYVLPARAILTIAVVAANLAFVTVVAQ